MDNYFEPIIKPSDPYLFHITHIDNLASLINYGLICRNKGIDFIDSSHLDVQNKRQNISKIPSGFSHSLHDYVPFSFAPLSPMLSAIHNNKVPNRVQTDMIYLVTKVSIVVDNKLSFIFTDGHPITTGLSDFFQDISDLPEVDWDIMKAKYWADTQEDQDRKRRRQAEFLIADSCPFSIISSICVNDQTKLECVKAVLASNPNSHTPKVIVKCNWYY